MYVYVELRYIYIILIVMIIKCIVQWESLANNLCFAKLKPSKFLLTIITFWLNLFIRLTFFHQMLEMSKFAKLSCYTVAKLLNSLIL